MRKTLIFIICLFLLINIRANAQSWLEKVGQRVKEKTIEKVEQKIEDKSEEVTDKVLDGAENTVKKTTKKTKQNSNKTEKKINSESDSKNTSNGDNDSKFLGSQSKTNLLSYTKYDFIPGDKVLYFEDFSQDAIGDFPALWTTNGGGEVKTVNIAQGHWFHMNKVDAVYCYTKQIAFPQNFIMEFDVIPDVEDDSHFGYTLGFYEDPDNVELTDEIYPGKKGVNIAFEDGDWLTKGYDNSLDVGGWLEGQSSTNPVAMKKVNHVIVWVQNRRLRIYHLGAKVLDMPTNIHAGTKFNRFRFSGWSTYGTPYVTNLKVTTASPDTRSKLITEGKLVSYGIYFDVNKDVVKPESYGTISDIAKVLKDNPTVSIKIIGHTDSDGNDAANLDLSKRRAASVKNALVSQFGIGDNRIQTDGKGETQPIASNTSSENKARNRRVEFIKL